MTKCIVIFNVTKIIEQFGKSLSPLNVLPYKDYRNISLPVIVPSLFLSVKYKISEFEDVYINTFLVSVSYKVKIKLKFP